MAEYGLDLTDEFHTASARRLWVLVKGLPPNSLLWAGDARWTRQDEFLAAQIELTDGWSRLIFAALGGKPKGDPLRIDRPEPVQIGPKPKKHIETDTEKIARFFMLHGGNASST